MIHLKSNQNRFDLLVSRHHFDSLGSSEIEHNITTSHYLIKYQSTLHCIESNVRALGNFWWRLAVVLMCKSLTI